MPNNKPVAISRFSDYTCTTQEYITDSTTGKVKVFFNIESAKQYLHNIVGIVEEQLDWFIYTPAYTCYSCSNSFLEGTIKMFDTGTEILCEHCYYAG